VFFAQSFPGGITGQGAEPAVHKLDVSGKIGDHNRNRNLFHNDSVIVLFPFEVFQPPSFSGNPLLDKNENDQKSHNKIDDLGYENDVGLCQIIIIFDIDQTGKGSIPDSKIAAFNESPQCINRKNKEQYG